MTGFDEIYLNEASNARLSGDLEKAEAKIKLALKINPNNILATHELGVIKFHNGEYVKALGIFQQVIEERPGHQQAIYKIGMCYYNLCDYRKALTYLEKVRDININYPNINKAIAKLAIENGNESLLEESIKNAIYVDKNDYEMIEMYAEFLLKKGRLDEAIKNYKKVITMCYKDISKYEQYIKLCIENEKYEEAEYTINVALKIEPENENIKQLKREFDEVC